MRGKGSRAASSLEGNRDPSRAKTARFGTSKKMSKLMTMRQAIADHVPDGASVALGLQMEQMIPFAAGHEIMRQGKRELRLIGPISDILFDQMIGAGCVEEVVAAWVGNVMMGSAYNFRRAAETENPGTPGEKLRVFNMTNFTLALALQAGAMGVPFLPTRTAMGSDVPKGNHFFYQIISPFEPKETLLAVRALVPDVAIVHLQRALLGKFWRDAGRCPRGEEGDCLRGRDCGRRRYCQRSQPHGNPRLSC